MKLLTRLSLGLLTLTLFSTSSIAGSEPAMQWIQKMSVAMQELSYQGRFIYLQNNQLESMSILHVKDSNGLRERLVSLNGEAREILRDNNNFTCVWPSSRQVVVDKSNKSISSPIWVPDDVKRLSNFYKFALVGKERIAEHEAVIVSITPADEYRYGMKVWIHQGNALLLQSILQDGQGQPIEQIMFTELSQLGNDDAKRYSVLPDIDDSYTLIRAHNGEENLALQGDSRWQLQVLPGGFRVESSSRKKLSDSEDYIQHMILSDGMASVSIFIEPTTEQSLSGESSMGAVNAYGLRLNEFSVIAIGEVPAITVKQLAESTHYQVH
ncbi:MAG: MucB/RseB C-terminal domain-containing protein [Gammaproteobacteria bacterium]|nr:MucB/RseB C-terminal domain-containing protein [Gammaproteobacteria bacterium]MBL6998905.1 MucB/RseB C-terminal domain-containing protein [Gammaproteobacteria bacterium]